jgi:hypothetical protein
MMAITDKDNDINETVEIELEIEEKDSSKEDNSRDSLGRFKPGQSGNPGGRPKKGETIVDQFRDNPKGIDVINNVIEVASTFGSDKQHKDAVSAVKLVIERLVPALKSSDINLNTDDDKGFIFMPTQSDAKKEDS